MALHRALSALLGKCLALERHPALPAQPDTSAKKAALKYHAVLAGIQTTIVIARIARPATSARGQWTAFLARLEVLVMKKTQQKNLGQNVNLAKPASTSPTRVRLHALTVLLDNFVQSHPRRQSNAVA